MAEGELPLSILMLYRQRLPAAAPQAVQWLSTAHALACAGAQVTLVADRPLELAPPERESLTLEAVLHAYELEPHPRLELRWLSSRHKTAAGLEYRWAVLQWLRQASALGRVPILYARRPDYARFWLELRHLAIKPLLVVYEWHYLSSANLREEGKFEEAQRQARLEAQLLERVDGHVVVSWGLAQALSRATFEQAPAELRAIIPATTESALLYLPNGGPPPHAHRRIESASREHSLVYAGLFRRVRDFEILLQALRELPAGFQLKLLGGDEDGSRLAHVKSRAEALGLRSRVQFLGYRSPRETRETLRHATLAVASFADSLNMRYFAAPLKLFEYQAAGVPFVCTDHPTTRALVRADEECLLVPADNATALAGAVRRLSSEEPLRHQLRVRGLEQAHRRTWQQRGLQLYAFLQNLSRQKYERRLG